MSDTRPYASDAAYHCTYEDSGDSVSYMFRYMLSKFSTVDSLLLLGEWTACCCLESGGRGNICAILCNNVSEKGVS